MKYKNRFLIIIASLAIMFVGSYFFYDYNIKNKLTAFKILDNTINGDQLSIDVSPSENAIYYEAIVKNNGNILNRYKIDSENIIIENISCYNNMEVNIEIFAYNKQGKSLKASNDINFKGNSNGLMKCTNTIFVGDSFDVLFTDYKEDITINLIKNEVLLEEKISGTHFVIDGKYFNNLGTYEIIIKDDEAIIDKQTIEVEPPKISSIFIDLPLNITRDNFYIWISGGENADTYAFALINDGTVIASKKGNSKYFYVDMSLLEEYETYNLVVSASNEFSKKKEQSITFTMPSKPLAEKPYSDRRGGKIFFGKMIYLSTPIQGANIYYTLDRTMPTVNSTLYDDPIMVDRQMTIKAITVKDNYRTSEMAMFNYFEDKRLPVIYLSPSTQYWNIGNRKAGYTNEQDIMNKIADVVERYLKESGFTVYRNTLDMNYKDAGNDSKAKDADVHLAIHSNASNGEWATGIETWVYTEKSYIAPLAKEIQANLENIYYKENTSYSGIKYNYELDSILYETNPLRVNNGILVEVAYHDQIIDAQWIMNNIELIGKTIAKTVIEYYIPNEKLIN